jgi:HK97 family phage major capsid protein
MNVHKPTRALYAGALALRGLRSLPSAEAPSLAEIKAMVDGITKNFSDMKVENDAALKKHDAVQSEKVEKINSAITSEMTKLQAAIDETAKQIAALKIGSSGPLADPNKKAHADAFDKFFRKGVEAGLRDLEIKAAMRTDSDPDGGYIVPAEMETSIDRVLSTVSAMRSLATVRQISTGMLKKPVNLGGTDSGWVGERQSRPETNTSTLSLLEFPAMELYANPAATQSMLDDAAVNIEQWISDEVSIVFAEQEGAAFITGSGVNRPRGILSYDTVANASYVWGKLGFIVTGVAADINDGSNNGIDKILDLVYGVKQGYRANSSFLMNRTLQGKVRKLKNTTSGDYLWAPPQVNGTQLAQPATLAGYPISDDDNMPDVGANAFPIAFGDFKRGYLIVDRVGIRVLRDPYTNKPYVMFYTTKRVGGGVQNFEAIKLLKCST